MGGGSSAFDVQDAERIRKKLSLPLLLAMKRGAHFKTLSDDHPATSAEIDAHVAAAKAIQFKVDLVTAASLQISFLQTVNLFPRLYGKENKNLFGVVAVRYRNTHTPDSALDTRSFLATINKTGSQIREVARNMTSEKSPFPYVFAQDMVERCLWRYETLWLPLCARHPDKKLVPPLDIDWVWHCHMLCPRMYQKDCVAVVERVMDRPFFARGSDRINARAETKKLWQDMTTEPFHIIGYETMAPVEIIPITTRKKMDTFQTELAYDIRGSMKRQAAFIHQIDFDYIADRQYLEAALSRYKQFLYVMKLDGGKSFVVPTYDMDLMWHAHQMYPLAYHQDTTRVVGGLVNHDDSVNDRAPAGKLDTSANKTAGRWRQVFGEPQMRAYGAYRGEPDSPSVALHALVKASKYSPKIQQLQPSSLYDENTTPNAYHGHEKSQRGMIMANTRVLALKAEDNFRVMIHIDKAYGFKDKSTSPLHYSVTILNHTKNKLQVVKGKPVHGKACVFNTRHVVVCHSGGDYGLCFNLYRKKLLGHKLIGSCSMPFQTLLKSGDLHIAGHLHLVDESNADAGELQVSLSITPVESDDLVLSLGVPSKTRNTEEDVVVADKYRLKSLRMDRSIYDQHGNSIFQVHEVNLCVIDEDEDPPMWACFSIDNSKALHAAKDPNLLPPVATAQSCYNKYQLEVPGIPVLPMIALKTQSLTRRQRTLYIQRDSTRLLVELKLAKSDTDPDPFWFELTDVSSSTDKEYHLFPGRRFGFAGTAGPGSHFDNCAWTLVCYNLSSQTSHALHKHSAGEEKAHPSTVSTGAASFLQRVQCHVADDVEKKAKLDVAPITETKTSRHAHTAAKHRHHPPSGMHVTRAEAVIDARGVLEANPWMDMVVVAAVAQALVHLITQEVKVNQIMRQRFTEEAKDLTEKSRSHHMDYCGGYFGGCGGWYVGMGSLWYMNTSHHGFGNTSMPTSTEGMADGGFAGMGACDMCSGCGGDWTGELGGTDFGFPMGGEFEYDMGMDFDFDSGGMNFAEGLDTGSMDLDLASGMDFSSFLGGIL